MNPAIFAVIGEHNSGLIIHMHVHHGLAPAPIYLCSEGTLSFAALIAVILVALLPLCCRLVSRLTASHDERVAAGAALCCWPHKLMQLPAEGAVKLHTLLVFPACAAHASAHLIAPKLQSPARDCEVVVHPVAARVIHVHMCNKHEETA